VRRESEEVMDEHGKKAVAEDAVATTTHANIIRRYETICSFSAWLSATVIRRPLQSASASQFLKKKKFLLFSLC
jgi:hypothetical protein